MSKPLYAPSLTYFNIKTEYELMKKENDETHASLCNV
jgi:hypothetical protein